MNVYMVLPAYNEENNIEALLKRIDSARPWANIAGQEITAIVVDDGSSDHTGEIADRIAQRGNWVEVIRHPVNKGLGGALLTGLQRATTMAGERDVIITMDGDNTMDPLVAITLAKRLTHDAIGVVSRYTDGAKVVGVPLYRQLISIMGSLMCRVVVGIPGLRDYTSGYRGYSAATLKAALTEWGEDLITSRAFDCQMELLLKVRPYIEKAIEVPMVLDYSCKLGSSNLRFWRTVRGYLKHFKVVFATRLELAFTGEGR